MWTKSHGPTTQIKPILLNLAGHNFYVLSVDFTTKMWISLEIFIMATIKSGRVKLRLRSFLVIPVRDSLRKTRRIVRARIKPKKCIESLRMTSCPPCWYPKTVKRRPRLVLTSFLMLTLPLVAINLHTPGQVTENSLLLKSPSSVQFSALSRETRLTAPVLPAVQFLFVWKPLNCRLMYNNSYWKSCEIIVLNLIIFLKFKTTLVRTVGNFLDVFLITIKTQTR